MKEDELASKFFDHVRIKYGHGYRILPPILIDGFSKEVNQKFFEKSLTIDVEAERLLNMNIATTKQITQLIEKQMKNSFVTESTYE